MVIQRWKSHCHDCWHVAIIAARKSLAAEERRDFGMTAQDCITPDKTPSSDRMASTMPVISTSLLTTLRNWTVLPSGL